jgi:hypothetical protein
MDFKDVINEHLELRRRNAGLEQSLPLARYRAQPMASEPRPGEIEPDLDETQEFSPDWLSPSKRRASPDLGFSDEWDVPPLFGSRD